MMNQSDRQRIKRFLDQWQGAGEKQKANQDAFFLDLCDALGVERPPEKERAIAEPYCLQKDVTISYANGATGQIDFYKAGHFLIQVRREEIGECGEKSGSKVLSNAHRFSITYHKEMEQLFLQALAYQHQLGGDMPFLLTCEIGSHFELWSGFTGDYGGYGARRTIPLEDLQKQDTFALFVDIFTDPQKRNSHKLRARVTRDVAGDFAELATSLVENQLDAEQVTNFLLRCVFSLFADALNLLPNKPFTNALKRRWIPRAELFKPEVEAFWNDELRTFEELIPIFGIQNPPCAIALTVPQLLLLWRASQRDWLLVEPAIFGTLVEQAFDPKERSKLGAHYTPRSHIERLVQAVAIAPIRHRWHLVQLEVQECLENDNNEPTAAQKRGAVSVLQDFLQELREITILDPACGTGNFLYVTLDLLKNLEAEVWQRMKDIAGAAAELINSSDRVNPSALLGIEINPRAARVAQIVIWIGYLQWHKIPNPFSQIPKPVPPASIECRDAILAESGFRTPSEWPSSTYIVSNPPFIGNSRMRDFLGDEYVDALKKTYEDVPNTVDFVMYWWHNAAQMVRSGKCQRFGLITTNSISQVLARAVIEYHLTKKPKLRLFFAIPDHPWIDFNGIRIAMTGAELSSEQRVLPMLGTVVGEGDGNNQAEAADNIQIEWRYVGRILSHLGAGADIGKTVVLKANTRLATRGVTLNGSGFILEPGEFSAVERGVLVRYVTGRDLMGYSRGRKAIDLTGMTAEKVNERYPRAYRWLLERVKPHRDFCKESDVRENWWLFQQVGVELRSALKGLKRYIVTSEVSKHRVFTFLDVGVLPDNGLVAIALDDAYFLGVLSSRVHLIWALATGGRVGSNNALVYSKTTCFDRFPFPNATPEQKEIIRDLGEQLYAHRRYVQGEHSHVTLTRLYNFLELSRAVGALTPRPERVRGKFRIRQSKGKTQGSRRSISWLSTEQIIASTGKSDRLSSKEEFEGWKVDKLERSRVPTFRRPGQLYRDKAFVVTLKHLHDAIDAAVLEAYGWSQDISDEEILEQLVALNAVRDREESAGFVHWLRPEYQRPARFRNVTSNVSTFFAEKTPLPQEAATNADTNEPAESEQWHQWWSDL